MTITAEQIDFGADKATPVISGAQKFIIPVPAYQDGGEPLVYPSGDEAGKPIMDWQKKPIGDRGLIFYNGTDKTPQAVKGDGNGVIIINSVNQEKAKLLEAKIDAVLKRKGFPDRIKTEEYIRNLGAGRHLAEAGLEYLDRRTVKDLTLNETKEILRYAREDLDLIDMYNSDKTFVSEKMSPVGASSGVAAYGLHKRDERDICHAVFVPGRGEFQGPAATPQQFENGAVILQQGKDVRLIQPDIFETTYKHADGRPIKVTELTTQNVGQGLQRADGKNWSDALGDRSGRKVGE